MFWVDSFFGKNCSVSGSSSNYLELEIYVYKVIYTMLFLWATISISETAGLAGNFKGGTSLLVSFICVLLKGSFNYEILGASTCSSHKLNVNFQAPPFLKREITKCLAVSVSKTAV